MSNQGKHVKVEYTGTFDDGEVFDSSKGREPLAFVCMAGQMIPGFDKAVESMEVGETKNVHIPCKDAYGERDESLVQKVPLDKIPNADQLPLNETIYMQNPMNGQPFPVRVIAKDDTTATFDMNSEMAGKDLNFEITLLEVTD